ncbi:uncharacterized protein I303_107161 [Kwoniella dejecticola CBS 10117]|uniref:Probable RNA-binding protein 18 n=1 Tax=Kwoniella dejecticola CBS 10117 TaxID=1296121 RepID=A0A1A5ZYX0_9TREE|nr:single-stranded nucleic acid binding protein [Kwoniella dejecticola CBS 10117]OBR83004.1 single-stranded nucleic acid binding protein [Kwoniella dejecticola CBS 10117]
MQSKQPIASSSSSTLSSLPAASSGSASGKPDRLYVGNLSPTIDEYTLIQVFSKYGKITKLDFMFHKTGVLKGKPRGFAFIQFSDKDDALKAMIKLHDRLLRGRKLVVTYASSAPPENLPLPIKGRRPTEPGKTTTLSLLKSSKKPQSAAAQIAAMEAKLAHMKRVKPADEDYVPGQSSSRNGTPNMDSLEGSPMPEETEMGDEEAALAAQALEAELSELVSKEGSATPAPTDIQIDSAPQEKSLEGTKTVIEDRASLALPPKPPTASGETIPPRPLTGEERSKQRGEALKKGLAGLPKKPVF